MTHHLVRQFFSSTSSESGMPIREGKACDWLQLGYKTST